MNLIFYFVTNMYLRKLTIDISFIIYYYYHHHYMNIFTAIFIMKVLTTQLENFIQTSKQNEENNNFKLIVILFHFYF